MTQAPKSLYSNGVAELALAIAFKIKATRSNESQGRELREEGGIGFGAAGSVVDGDRGFGVGCGDSGGHGKAVIAVSFDRSWVGREGLGLSLDGESVFGDLMFDVDVCEQVGD